MEPLDSKNNSLSVEGDLGDLQIVEDSTDSDNSEGHDDTSQETRIVAGNDHVPNFPKDLMQASSQQAIGSVTVSNSENIHFGNKTYFNGPVTIKHVAQPSSGFDNAGYDNKYDPDNITKNAHQVTKEDLSFKKYITLNWIKLAMWGVGFLLIFSTFVTVLVFSTNSDMSGQDHTQAFNEQYENGSSLVVAPGHLRLVSRTDWLAQPVVAPLDPLRQPAPWVIITHTATPNCLTQSKCVLRVRLIQTFHIESREWLDIGYNFMVGGDGSAYVGRGWDYMGAHTKGYNKYSIGIAFIGTFNTESPTKLQVQACFNLIQQGVAEGKLTKDYKIFAHRQLMSTLSPGDRVYDIIKTWPHFVNTSTDTDITKLLPNY